MTLAIVRPLHINIVAFATMIERVSIYLMVERKMDQIYRNLGRAHGARVGKDQPGHISVGMILKLQTFPLLGTIGTTACQTAPKCQSSLLFWLCSFTHVQ